MNECPDCGTYMAPNATRCSCGYAIKKQYKKDDKFVDDMCPWDDHGMRCSIKGAVSDSTNGTGPYYCSKHYFVDLKKWQSFEEWKAMQYKPRKRLA